MVAIYAGFAIFLATLIWIYVSWLILLIGAQLSFYVQNPRYLRVGQGHVRLTSALRERLAFTVMLLIARKFVAGERPWELRALSEDLEITGAALATVTRSLERAGLLTLSEDEELIPARDLEAIALTDILNAVRDERKYETWLLWRARTEPVADEIANSVEAGMRERIAGISLRELASRPPHDASRHD
jgi:membrane protein